MPFQPRLLPLLVASALVSLSAQAEDIATLSEITITGNADVATPYNAYAEGAGSFTDVAGQLTRVPGAAIVRNGAQTGIVQLRGLFNERVRVRVDGMEITPACPNHMDPPLHYAGFENLEALDVLVGATPVSLGGDSLTGSVEVKSRAPKFGQSAEWDGSGRVSAGYDSARGGKSAALEADAFNDTFNLRYAGGYENADDYASARGDVAATGYTTQRHGLSGFWKAGDGVLQLAAGTHKSRNVGTPTLPMDMVKDDATNVRAGWDGETALGTLSIAAFWHDIDHVMDNFSMRPVAGMRMQAPSTSENLGVNASLTRAAAGGNAKFGAEYSASTLDVWQLNLSMMGTPRQDMFNNATRDRTGVYGEWEGKVAEALTMNAGVRGDFVRMDADNIVNAFAAAVADRTAFNARSHQRSDNNVDATLALRYKLDPVFALEGALTRKTRSPSILERFLYTASGASAGQADGFNYKGNLDLKPEVAHGVSAGISGKYGSHHAKVEAYWTDVNDFIQGQLAAPADTFLTYTNVNARLWGFEASAGATVLRALEIGSWLSLARGQNTDNGDNLYRLAPLRGGLSADWRAGDWSLGAEVIASARKTHVSRYNNEPVTPGYGLLNLRGSLSFAKNFEVSAGIDNVFDRYYVDPLAGVNRVAGSVVAPGLPLPGVGRSGYVRLNWRF